MTPLLQQPPWSRRPLLPHGQTSFGNTWLRSAATCFELLGPAAELTMARKGNRGRKELNISSVNGLGRNHRGSRSKFGPIAGSCRWILGLALQGPGQKPQDQGRSPRLFFLSFCYFFLIGKAAYFRICSHFNFRLFYWDSNTRPCDFDSNVL